MADELRFLGDPSRQSGLAFVAQVFDGGGAQVGADMAMSEVGSSAVYVADMPNAPAGAFGVRFLNGGVFRGGGCIYWDGTAEVDELTLHIEHVDLDADHASLAAGQGALAVEHAQTQVDIGNLPTPLTAAQVNAEVDSAVAGLATGVAVANLNDLSAADVAGELAAYDAATKGELDAVEAAIVAAMPTPDEMTAAELHAGLDSYANKDDFKAGAVSLAGLATAADVASAQAALVVEHDATQAAIAGLPSGLSAAQVNAEVDAAIADAGLATAAGVSGLNDLSVGDVAAELAAYDAATGTELVAAVTALVAEHDTTQSALATLPTSALTVADIADELGAYGGATSGELAAAVNTLAADHDETRLVVGTSLAPLQAALDMLIAYHDNEVRFFGADGATEVVQSDSYFMSMFAADGATVVKQVAFRAADGSPTALASATRYVKTI